MNVLFLMFVFPDLGKSFNMYTSLAREFHKRGHKVTVIAPSEPGGVSSFQLEEGINILRVRSMPLKNVGTIYKGLSNLLLPRQYQKAIKRNLKEEHFNLIVTATPPITFAGLADSLKRKYNAKVYLILRDIFPQNAVDLGFFRKGGLLHRYFRSKEKRLYRIADQIGCMSPANIRYVIEHNKDFNPKKLHELKNFQQPFFDTKTPKQEIREKYSLDNKFVIVFGGNMGKPQGLENVIELAKRSSKFRNVLFLLLGEGVMMENLKKEIRQSELKNIRIINTIPKHEYQLLLGVCDVGLISLNERFTVPNIPSKTLDYFNVGLPILASVDKATDYNQILEEIGAGLWSYAGDHDDLMKNFERLYYDSELRKKMTQNGRAYFLENLTPDIAYQTIVNRLN